MSIPPSGDVFSMALFGILLASIVGLVGYVWIKLGARPKVLTFRNLKVLLNPGLPAGKIVLTDAQWQPLGETDPGHFDSVVLPPGCAAALLSTKDFATFAAGRRATTPPLAAPRLRA